jgi:gamma-F420-2:alpha-L-glutamate ligase
MEKISVPHKTHSNTENPYVEISIPSEYKKYGLNPSVRHENKEIIFYNATDLSFYDRKPENPIATVWLLRCNIEFNYVTRRLLEQAFEMNIHLVHLQSENFEVIMAHDGLEHMTYKGKKITYADLPDAIMPRIGATINYLTLSVLKQLQAMGGRMINDVASLENTKDKLRTYQALATHKLPIPKTLLVRFPSTEPKFDGNLVTICKTFTFPVILKVGSGSQGKGVMMIQNEDNMKDIFDMLDKSNPLLVQEFIKNSSGRDVRVIVVGGKVVSAMMRVANKGFKSNFHQGGYVQPVEINEEIEQVAVKAAQIVGLQIAGVDLLLGENGYIICEINASPGFEGFELATGINTAKSMLTYVLSVAQQPKPKIEEKKLWIVPVMKEHLV